jgi:hypothetical protein
MTSIKEKMKAMAPSAYKTAKKTYILLRKKGDLIRYPEKEICLGNENPDKIFYVIPSVQYASFGAIFNKPILGGICHARERNWIPVVDFRSENNWFITEDEVGKVNGWERFFQQPMGYTLESIAQSRHIRIPNTHFIYDGPVCDSAFFNNEYAQRDDWKAIFAQYIKLQPEVEDYISKKQNQLGIGPGVRAVGVKCRGTDYAKNKTYGHQIQPEPEEIIAKVREVQQKYSCQKVFLSCEDEDYRKAFAQAFPGQLVVSEPAMEYQGKGILYLKDLGNFQTNLDYLTSLALVARSTCVVATACGGSMVSALMAHTPEYEYYFLKGIYGIDDVERAPNINEKIVKEES